MKKFFLITSLLASQLIFAHSTKVLASNNEVIIKFKNAKEAQQYMTYMIEQGEQDVGNSMAHMYPELDKIPEYDFEKQLIDYSK